MKKIVFTLLLIIFSHASAEDHPSLLDVTIGQPFEHPNATVNKDTHRPTTQYRVPNHGETETIFPEYQISYLNDSNAVAIVTGEIATSNQTQCNKLKEKVAQLAHTKFPNHVKTPISESQLNGSEEYSKKGSNTYYVLQCQGSYGPFMYLHFQLRGIEQDRQLKAAWSKYLGNNER